GSRDRRERDPECRPRPQPALDGHRAAVHLDDAAHDGQAQPAAAAARLAGARAAEEPVEDPGQLGGVDAHARVGDGDRRAALGVAADLYTDPPAARRELDRIAHEVRDDLADADRIVPDLDR